MKYIVIAAMLVLAACKPASMPLAAADPSDPSVRVPQARYSSALGDYKSRRPVDPGPWRQQNERVAPQMQR